MGLDTVKTTYRGKLPKPDSRGYVRPEVGGIRFTVGHSKTESQGEMERRLKAIRDLFEQHCKRHETDKWQDWMLGYARQLAKGDRTVLWEVGDVDIGEESVLVEELNALGFEVHVSDPASLAQGRRELEEWLHKEIQTQVRKAIAAVKGQMHQVFGPIANNLTSGIGHPECFETKTFHEALDGFEGHLKATGNRDSNDNLKTSVRKLLDRVGYLKKHHADLPLFEMNLATLEEQAAYWRNRPKTKKGIRCSLDHARDMGKVTARFLRWLDNSPDFQWKMPRGAERIKRTPVKLSQDDNRQAFQTVTKETYTPEQLAVIVKHTDDFGKALIAACVNCAFGQSEIGQWPTSKFALFTVHPHAQKVGVESTSEDSWIVGPRPKTGVYGEHLLWPEVAKAIEPFLDERDVLPITSKGTWWYRTHSNNPQSKFAKWWKDLLDKVCKKQASFPRLPFGSLRDTLPNVLRANFSDEVASIALQHGSLGEDELLKCYANVPFKKLFNATREMRKYFKPLLDAL